MILRGVFPALNPYPKTNDFGIYLCDTDTSLKNWKIIGNPQPATPGFHHHQRLVLAITIYSVLHAHLRRRTGDVFEDQSRRLSSQEQLD